jgi:Flp pilus assembly pilin Flp
MRSMKRLWRETTGQDLVEYALITMFFGIALLAVWDGITAALGLTFSEATTGVQSLWEPPDPGAASP